MENCTRPGIVNVRSLAALARLNSAALFETLDKWQLSWTIQDEFMKPSARLHSISFE